MVELRRREAGRGVAVLIEQATRGSLHWPENGNGSQETGTTSRPGLAITNRRAGKSEVDPSRVYRAAGEIRARSRTCTRQSDQHERVDDIRTRLVGQSSKVGSPFSCAVRVGSCEARLTAIKRIRDGRPRSSESRVALVLLLSR
jgi:hypothetical protein